MSSAIPLPSMEWGALTLSRLARHVVRRNQRGHRRHDRRGAYECRGLTAEASVPQERRAARWTGSADLENGMRLVVIPPLWRDVEEWDDDDGER